MIHLACIASKTGSEFWATQLRTTNTLAAELASLEPVPAVAADFTAAAENAKTGDTQHALCAAAFNILTRTQSDVP